MRIFKSNIVYKPRHKCFEGEKEGLDLRSSEFNLRIYRYRR